jgi:CspA family cold shock protein
MHQCICKWWDSKKGFGFIIPNGGGDDIFCHVTAIQLAGYDNLLSGDVVSFDLAPDRNGNGRERPNHQRGQVSMKKNRPAEQDRFKWGCNQAGKPGPSGY